MSIPNPTGRRLTPEHREKLRLAKLGKKHAPEHNAKISAGLRRWNDGATAEERRRGIRRHLTEAELAEWIVLQQNHIPRDEALQAIGRLDLLSPDEASAATERPPLGPFPIKVPKSQAPKGRAQPRLTASDRCHLAALGWPVTL